MLKVFATPRCGVNFWAQGVVSQVHFLLISSAGLRIIACYTSRLFHQHFWQIDFEPKFWPFRFWPITICPHWDFESSALEDALLFAASLRPNDGILGCSLFNSAEYGHRSPWLDFHTDIWGDLLQPPLATQSHYIIIRRLQGCWDKGFLDDLPQIPKEWMVFSSKQTIQKWMVQA